MILGIRILFGPISPKVFWYPKYPKTGKTLPSDGFYTWVRLQLMWNWEFNTFNGFLYNQVYDLGYLGPISRTCSSAQKYTKTSIH